MSRQLYPRERLGTHCIGRWLGLRPIWTGAENLAHAGIRYPDRPARSQTIYRLSYPVPQGNNNQELKTFQWSNRKWCKLAVATVVLRCSAFPVRQRAANAFHTLIVVIYARYQLGKDISTSAYFERNNRGYVSWTFRAAILDTRSKRGRRLHLQYFSLTKSRCNRRRCEYQIYQLYSWHRRKLHYCLHFIGRICFSTEPPARCVEFKLKYYIHIHIYII